MMRSGQLPPVLLTDTQQYPGVEKIGSKPVVSAPPKIGPIQLSNRGVIEINTLYPILADWIFQA